MRAPLALAAAFVLALTPAPAPAHPHVFVDWRAGFELDAGGRVAALRVTWLFDEFYSMLVLTELGLDPAAPPDAAGLALLAALQPDWVADFGGDGVLSVGGAPAALDAVEGVTAEVVAGRLAITFRRPLAAPADPRAAEVRAEVFDPVFFVAYTLVAPIEVLGPGAAGCVAAVKPFDADARLEELQGTLFALGPDETPPDPTVGRLFADRAVLTCG